MTDQDLPSVGERLYFLHREVIVTKVYSLFQLVKISYVNETVEFSVDACTITKKADTSESISMKLLVGEV